MYHSSELSSNALADYFNGHSVNLAISWADSLPPSSERRTFRKASSFILQDEQEVLNTFDGSQNAVLGYFRNTLPKKVL